MPSQRNAPGHAVRPRWGVEAARAIARAIFMPMAKTGIVWARNSIVPPCRQKCHAMVSDNYKLYVNRLTSMFFEKAEFCFLVFWQTS
jgi:hypothetical protein